jgi:hypothetical protein
LSRFPLSKLFYKLREEAEIADLSADLLQARPTLLVQEGAEENLTSTRIMALEKALLVLLALPLIELYREKQWRGKC